MRWRKRGIFFSSTNRSALLKVEVERSRNLKGGGMLGCSYKIGMTSFPERRRRSESVRSERLKETYTYNFQIEGVGEDERGKAPFVRRLRTSSGS
jgi:hypothetical protein